MLNVESLKSALDVDQLALIQMQVFGTMCDHVRSMPVKNKKSLWLSQDKALQSPWLQMHLNDRHFMMIDFDNLGAEHWKVLPVQPNIVCFNRDNGNHQCFWLLKDKVFCDKKGKKQSSYKYLRKLEKALDIQYRGDKHFARAIHKNIFHPKWETNWLHDNRFTLNELHQGLKLDLRLVGKTEQEIVAANIAAARTKKKAEGKRNSTIFDSVRFRAYKEITKYKLLGINFDDWQEMVTQWCYRANSFADDVPLQNYEINSTSKSIAKFCWFIYTPPQPKKPKMTKEEIRTAQQKAQRMTKAKQVGRSEAAIKEAIAQLKADGKKVTKVAVSKLSGVSRTQVNTKYKYLFD